MPKRSSIDYETRATPRAITADGVPVFCAFDEIVKLSDLRPNPGNPNQHNSKQIEKLGNIIRAAGWRNTITVSRRSGMIVKGHGRLQAALWAVLTEAPVEYQEYESDAEEWADLIADNRLAELSTLDTGALVDMVSEIDGVAPVELTGYTPDDIEAIIAAMAGEGDAEDDGADAVGVPEGDYEPFTKPGDIWRLGQHRLLCGSATDAEAIDWLMSGEKAQLVHTDPPYGVAYETQSGKFGMIKNDDLDPDALMQLLTPAFKNYVRYTDDDAAFYIWHAFTAFRDFDDAMTAAGIMKKQYIIWWKPAPSWAMQIINGRMSPVSTPRKPATNAIFTGTGPADDLESGPPRSGRHRDDVVRRRRVDRRPGRQGVPVQHPTKGQENQVHPAQ